MESGSPIPTIISLFVNDFRLTWYMKAQSTQIVKEKVKAEEKSKVKDKVKEEVCNIQIKRCLLFGVDVHRPVI